MRSMKLNLKTNIAFSIIILSLIGMITAIYADSNGVWHASEDIKPGIFGGDEGIDTDYQFINKVNFNNLTTFNKNLIFERIVDIDNQNFYMDLDGTTTANEIHAIKFVDYADPSFEVVPSETSKVNIIKAEKFLYPSDIKLKKNIRDIENYRDILNINGKRYEWKENNVSDIGVIAQEVELYFPTLVNTDLEGQKTVDYIKLIPLILEIVKEQETEITNLKKELNKNE